VPGNHNNIEKRLWGAADELRANSKLKASEYSLPVLGLIFLKYADFIARFTPTPTIASGLMRDRGSPRQCAACASSSLAQIFNLIIQFNSGARMIVKAIYQNSLLRPLEKVDLKEGEEVDIEIRKRSIFGILKGWDVNSQSLKDELREIND